MSFGLDSFIYERTVRFADTDAAGVVYFANILSFCHEAYEAALMAAGLDLRRFFTNPDLAIPIVATEAKFLQPLFCGDWVEIKLEPSLTGVDSFTIAYTLSKTSKLEESQAPDQLIALASTKHVCIVPQQRQRHPLPQEILDWLLPSLDDF